MKSKVNFYLAILLIAILAVGAALLLVHVEKTANSFPATLGGSETKYSELKQSILEQ